MAKRYNGVIDFSLAFSPSGPQPLDDRLIVYNYSDLTKDTFSGASYEGMQVYVLENKKYYVLVDRELDKWEEIGSGNLLADNYTEALSLATIERIGQIIYVKNSEEITPEDGGDVVTYSSGPYIVIGNGDLQKLGTSSASGDLSSDVANLTTRVSNVENTIQTLTGDSGTTGSIDNKIATAIAGLTDKVVSSGALITNDDDGQKYLRLILNDEGQTEVDINVNDLVDYYGAAENGGLKLSGNQFSIEEVKDSLVKTVSALTVGDETINAGTSLSDVLSKIATKVNAELLSNKVLITDDISYNNEVLVNSGDSVHTAITNIVGKLPTDGKTVKISGDTKSLEVAISTDVGNLLTSKDNGLFAALMIECLDEDDLDATL